MVVRISLPEEDVELMAQTKALTLTACMKELSLSAHLRVWIRD